MDSSSTQYIEKQKAINETCIKLNEKLKVMKKCKKCSNNEPCDHNGELNEMICNFKKTQE